MATTVKLDDIAEGMEFQTEETAFYLNKKTGEVVTIIDRDFRAAEDSEPIEHFPEWEHENLKEKRSTEIVSISNLNREHRRKFLAVQNNLICQR